jgi:hypothetical protein
MMIIDGHPNGGPMFVISGGSFIVDRLVGLVIEGYDGLSWRETTL